MEMKVFPSNEPLSTLECLEMFDPIISCFIKQRKFLMWNEEVMIEKPFEAPTWSKLVLKISTSFIIFMLVTLLVTMDAWYYRAMNSSSTSRVLNKRRRTMRHIMYLSSPMSLLWRYDMRKHSDLCHLLRLHIMQIWSICRQVMWMSLASRALCIQVMVAAHFGKEIESSF